MVAPKFCDLLLHFVHLRDSIYVSHRRRFHLRACSRKARNVPQPIEQAQWHLVVIYYFWCLQKLNGRASPLLLMRLERARTSNVTLAILKAAPCERTELEDVECTARFHMGEPTSKKATPYLLVFSNDLSVGLAISGMYSSNILSSSCSDGRRGSTCANIISWP